MPLSSWRLLMIVAWLGAACAKAPGEGDPDMMTAGDSGPRTDGSGTQTACDDPATCVYEASCPPVLDPSSLPACAPDAHCIPRSLVEAAAPDMVDNLAPCSDPTLLCIPDVFIRSGGAYVPATCTSLNNAEGRCISMALPLVSEQAGFLPQSSCTANERCAPCYNPLDGTETGACSMACDTGPTQPPAALPACCGGRARCVPRAVVPSDEADQLAERECEDIQAGAYLCVPTELLEMQTPPRCNANSWLFGSYGGVCMSDCVDFGDAEIVLDQGSCRGGYLCAPCTDPLSGEPTGAPGC